MKLQLKLILIFCLSSSGFAAEMNNDESRRLQMDARAYGLNFTVKIQNSGREGFVMNTVGQYLNAAPEIIRKEQSYKSGRSLDIHQVNQIRDNARELRVLMHDYMRAQRGEFSESGLLKYMKEVLPLASAKRASAIGAFLATVTPIAQYYINEQTSRSADKAVADFFKGGMSNSFTTGVLLKVTAHNHPLMADVIDSEVGSIVQSSVLESADEILEKHKDVKSFEQIEEIRKNIDQLNGNTDEAKKAFNKILQKKDTAVEENNKKIDQLQKLLTEKLQNEEDQKMAAQIKHEKLSLIERKYEALSVWNANVQIAGHLLKINPALMTKLDTVAKASMLIGKTSELLKENEGPWSRSLASGNYIQAGLMLIGMFQSSGPSADEIILQQLQLIRQDIYELRVQIQDSFHSLNQNIVTMHLQTMESLDEIIRTQGQIKDSLKNLESDLNKVKLLAQSNSDSRILDDYRQTLLKCLPLSYDPYATKNSVLTPRVEAECARKIIELAALKSTQMSQTHQYSEDDKNEFQYTDNFMFAKSLRALGQFASQNAYQSKKMAPYLNGTLDNYCPYRDPSAMALPIADPYYWTLALNDLLQISKTHNRAISPHVASLVARPGKNLVQFFADLGTNKVKDKEDVRKLDVPSLKNRIQNSASSLKVFTESLSANLQKTTADRFNFGMPSFFETGRSLQKDYVPKVESTVKYCNGKKISIHKSNALEEKYKNGFPLNNHNFARLYFRQAYDVSDQEYKEFADFSNDKDGHPDIQISGSEILRMIPNTKEFKIAEQLNAGFFRLCVEEVEFPSLDIRRLVLESGNISQRSTHPAVFYKEWLYRLNMTLRLEFVLNESVEHNPRSEVFIISRKKLTIVQNEFEEKPYDHQNFHYNTHSVKKNILNSAWNQHLRKMLMSNSAQELFSKYDYQRSRSNFKNHFERIFKSAKSQQVLTLDNTSAASNARKNRQVLEAALFKGAYPLFENNKADAVARLLSGENSLPSVGKVYDLMLESGYKKEQIYDLIDQTSAKLQAEIEKLENEEFEPFIPEISIPLMQLEIRTKKEKIAPDPASCGTSL